jgi:hypothetical protein
MPDLLSVAELRLEPGAGSRPYTIGRTAPLKSRSVNGKHLFNPILTLKQASGIDDMSRICLLQENPCSYSVRREPI